MQFIKHGDCFARPGQNPMNLDQEQRIQSECLSIGMIDDPAPKARCFGGEVVQIDVDTRKCRETATPKQRLHASRNVRLSLRKFLQINECSDRVFSRETDKLDLPHKLPPECKAMLRVPLCF